MQQMFWDGIRQGEDRAKLMHEIPNIVLNWEPTSESDVEDMETLLWMWDGFAVDYWQYSAYRPIATEFEFIWELPRIPEQPEWLTITLKTIIDLLMVNTRTGKLSPWDHKSTGTLGSVGSFSTDMDVDDQVGLYLATCREIVRTKALGKFSGVDTAWWSYAITSQLKGFEAKKNGGAKKERPMEARFWKVPSIRSNAHMDMILREASLTVLDAYKRPLDVEPPRSPDKEKCVWRCDHRDACFYARANNRRVQVVMGVKEDQMPEGISTLLG